MKNSIVSLLFVSLLGCSGGSITLNGAEVSEEYFDAFCRRAADCGFITPGEVGECVDVLVQATCEAVDCSETYTMSEDEWNACVGAVDDQSCSAIDAGVLPSECNTIDALQ